MRIRWYSPSLGDFEWREMPETDEEALRLLYGPSDDRACVEVYRGVAGAGGERRGGALTGRGGGEGG
ncbi:MAG: hypothetical protein WKF95_19395 [Rubrobacter sp.]